MDTTSLASLTLAKTATEIVPSHVDANLGNAALARSVVDGEYTHTSSIRTLPLAPLALSTVSTALARSNGLPVPIHHRTHVVAAAASRHVLARLDEANLCAVDDDIALAVRLYHASAGDFAAFRRALVSRLRVDLNSPALDVVAVPVLACGLDDDLDAGFVLDAYACRPERARD